MLLVELLRSNQESMIRWLVMLDTQFSMIPVESKWYVNVSGSSTDNGIYGTIVSLGTGVLGVAHFQNIH